MANNVSTLWRWIRNSIPTLQTKFTEVIINEGNEHFCLVDLFFKCLYGCSALWPMTNAKAVSP